MFNNPYMMNNNQNINERIDNEIEKLKQMKANMQQPIQPITQNFQLAPQNKELIRYANSINEVQKDFVIGDTPYFSKDMSVVWIKSPKGDIKTYELNEIVPKDEKDLMIESLQMQINELRGKIENDANVTNVNSKQISTDTDTNDGTIGTTIKENEPRSIQKISRSEKK